MSDSLAKLSSSPNRIGVAADHGECVLKTRLVNKLREASYDVIDGGAYQVTLYDDYPDFVVPLACAVSSGAVERGVTIGGSGVGTSVVANKVPGVRVSLIHEAFSAHQGVEDDNINVFCLGGRVAGQAFAWELVKIFLAARFSGAERHRRRLAKVAKIESKEIGL